MATVLVSDDEHGTGGEDEQRVTTTPRLAVQRFAAAMEHKLRANDDHKRGWHMPDRQDSESGESDRDRDRESGYTWRGYLLHLLYRLYEETEELWDATDAYTHAMKMRVPGVPGGPGGRTDAQLAALRDAVRDEAADVGNFALFVADVAGALAGPEILDERGREVQ
jgi:NTP pyrophosphatase (non-canonical NTP hydrolase)